MTQPAAKGQDHEGAEGTKADFGLFGPGSATWQLMGEPILWVHCAEVSSYVDICGRCGMGATPDQLDALVDEQRGSAAEPVAPNPLARDPRQRGLTCAIVGLPS